MAGLLDFLGVPAGLLGLGGLPFDEQNFRQMQPGGLPDWMRTGPLSIPQSGGFAPDEMSSVPRAPGPPMQIAPQPQMPRPPMGLPQLDGDNNPIPGLGQQFGAMPQQAMAQAPTPQMGPQTPTAPQQDSGPGILQRLAGTGGVIGGMANTIGALTGQGGGAVNPETSTGPAGQVYRLMLAKGMNPVEAKFLASRQDTALAWVKANLTPQELTNDIKNFQYGQKNPAFMQHQVDLKRAGATTIKNEGNIPPGYEVERNSEGLPIRLKPIPGSPAAVEAEEKIRKAEEARRLQTTSANIVTQDIDRAVNLVNSAALPTTGAGGNFLKGLPSTAAHDVSKLVDTIKANSAFDKLQQMRQSSPTGGALGGVSEKETALLQAAIGSLEQSQSKEQFVDNLRRVKNVMLDIVHGPGQGPAREKLGFEQSGSGFKILGVR